MEHLAKRPKRASERRKQATEGSGKPSAARKTVPAVKGAPTSSDAGKLSPGDGLVAKGNPNTLELKRRDGESAGKTLARTLIDPLARHASLSSVYAYQVFGGDEQPSITETAALLGDELDKTVGGDLTMVTRILASQAISLDAMFTELARRSSVNMGQHLDAMERYMRLALKAQSASRSTLEALARLHQPREQTVRHVHVNGGGQAVIADQFHHHAGGKV